jgi:hypothetical protein
MPTTTNDAKSYGDGWTVDRDGCNVIAAVRV